MPTASRREDIFIERFLSAYESGSWANAKVCWLDKMIDGAVEAVATRPDGTTLAIEHTIIEPFVNEKEDFAFFEAAFLKIEQDQSLPIPGKWIQVFVPVGILRGQSKRAARDAIVDAVHNWLSVNRLSLCDGWSEHKCRVPATLGKPAIEVKLNIKVVPLRSRSVLHVRRQQTSDDLGQVVEKALAKKLPKLVNTEADKRILFLERQHMNLLPESILREIEKRRDAFPDLAKVDEIWIVETIFYGTTFGGLYLRFERYQDGKLVESFNFDDAELLH